MQSENKPQKIHRIDVQLVAEADIWTKLCRVGFGRDLAKCHRFQNGRHIERSERTRIDDFDFDAFAGELLRSRQAFAQGTAVGDEGDVAARTAYCGLGDIGENNKRLLSCKATGLRYRIALGRVRSSLIPWHGRQRSWHFFDSYGRWRVSAAALWVPVT